ncbi:MAG: TrmH family RNA methyltransferase [Clostridiales bacterium]|nr:TrmH family RNA methyltransferase [Clostridiales bacterium]
MPSLSPYRQELDYGYAPGFFPSMECLLKRPECARRVLLKTEAQGTEASEKLMELAKRMHVRVELADKALKWISGKDNCYAAVVFTKCEQELAPDRPHIVMHHPSDSGNAGTIMRTALGLGFSDIAMIRPCVDVFDPHTVRSSMGSLFSLNVHVYSDFDEYRRMYPEHVLYPFMLDASVPLEKAVECKIPEKFSLVFGNEGSGLPHEFSCIGQPVRIESNEKVDSLNLSIAAAIGMYAFSGKAGLRSRNEQNE